MKGGSTIMLTTRALEYASHERKAVQSQDRHLQQEIHPMQILCSCSRPNLCHLKTPCRGVYAMSTSADQLH